jgi:hypothetical protein
MLRLSLLHPHVTIDPTHFTAHRRECRKVRGGGGEGEGYSQEPDQ